MSLFAALATANKACLQFLAFSSCFLTHALPILSSVINKTIVKKELYRSAIFTNKWSDDGYVHV